jgi:hypothetical protein
MNDHRLPLETERFIRKAVAAAMGYRDPDGALQNNNISVIFPCGSASRQGYEITAMYPLTSEKVANPILDSVEQQIADMLASQGEAAVLCCGARVMFTYEAKTVEGAGGPVAIQSNIVRMRQLEFVNCWNGSRLILPTWNQVQRVLSHPSVQGALGMKAQSMRLVGKLSMIVAGPALEPRTTTPEGAYVLPEEKTAGLIDITLYQSTYEKGGRYQIVTFPPGLAPCERCVAAAQQAKGQDEPSVIHKRHFRTSSLVTIKGKQVDISKPPGGYCSFIQAFDAANKKKKVAKGARNSRQEKFSVPKKSTTIAAAKP